MANKDPNVILENIAITLQGILKELQEIRKSYSKVSNQEIKESKVNISKLRHQIQLLNESRNKAINPIIDD